MDILHHILDLVVEGAILMFEFIGVGVLIVSGIYGVYSYFRRDRMTRLNLARGMAMGLEFKLGSEILRTVVVRESSEMLFVAGIIVLRTALTFLIHWEIHHERVESQISNQS